MEKKELYTSVVFSSARPIIYNQELCIGCNRCADVCQADVLVHSVNKGEHPIVMYPGECWYCGAWSWSVRRKAQLSSSIR